MNILLVGPVPPLRGGISDFNNELISTINKDLSIFGEKAFLIGHDINFWKKIDNKTFPKTKNNNYSS